MEAPTQTPVLKHRAEFDAYLGVNGTYEASQESIETFQSIPSVWLTGTSNSGRTTLITRILETTDEFLQPISDTTRETQVRDGKLEKNGQSYWHISEEEFLAGLEEGRYLEAAIIHNRQVSGVNVAEIQKVKDMGKTALRDVEIAGIIRLHRYNPRAIYIMMLPPEFTSLMARFNTRSGGEMSQAEILDRIKSGIKEISIGLTCDFLQLMVSSDLEENVQLVRDRISGTITELPNQEDARAHAEQLLVDMKKYVEAADQAS